VLNLKTDKMKTFDSGLNQITVDKNNLIAKIEDRDCWSFDVELHPELHECLNCFEDNLLNEFMMAQPSTINELVAIVKEQYDYWDMKTVNETTVYDYDENSLKIGFGFNVDDNWEYMTVITPMITFKLKS
jgi:hypothetical protein